MAIFRLYILFIFALSSLLVACGNKLDASRLPINNQFVMSDNLICTVVAGSDQKEIGNKIAFMGLTTDKPKVKYESGTTSPMQKIFESESTVTIQLVATIGSVDTFVIDKKNGHFSRAAAGSLAGVYSLASVGTCK